MTVRGKLTDRQLQITVRISAAVLGMSGGRKGNARVSQFQLRFYNSLPGLFTVPLTRMTDLLSRLKTVFSLSFYAVSNVSFGELTKIVVKT